MRSGRKVVGLIRVSTLGQASEDRAGIPRQRECIERVVKDKQLRLVEMIELIDVSGTNTLNAPEIQRMILQIRNHEVDGVVMSDLDRLFRPEKMMDFSILAAFEETGAMIYSDTGNYDFSSDEGRFIGILKGAFGGHELRQIKRRMSGGRERKRRAGKLAGSKILLPTGVSYDWKEESFFYSERINEVVEAFRIVDEEGITNYAAIARRTGLKARTLYYLLRNPLLNGWRVIDQKRGDERYRAAPGHFGDRKKVARDEDDVIRIRVIDPPAVTDERWQRVQRRLKDASTRWRRERATAGTTINLGVGVSRCDHCGGRLYASSGKRRDRVSTGYYYCSKNYYLNQQKGASCPQPAMRKEYVHRLLQAFVGKHLRDRKVIAAIIGRFVQKPAPVTAFDPTRRLQQLSQEEDRLLSLYLKADTARIAKLDPRLAQIKAERRHLTHSATQQLPSRGTNCDVQGAMRRLVRGCYAFARLATEGEQQEALHALFSEIKFRDDEIVGFRLNSPADEAVVTQNGNPADMDSSRRRA